MIMINIGVYPLPLFFNSSGGLGQNEMLGLLISFHIVAVMEFIIIFTINSIINKSMSIGWRKTIDAITYTAAALLIMAPIVFDIVAVIILIAGYFTNILK